MDFAVKEVRLESTEANYLDQCLKVAKVIKHLHHKHVIKLLGSFLHGNTLSLLLWPITEFTLEDVLFLSISWAGT